MIKRDAKKATREQRKIKKLIVKIKLSQPDSQSVNQPTSHPASQSARKTFGITLIEIERVISQDHKTAKTFKEYVISIPIKKNQEYKRL